MQLGDDHPMETGEVEELVIVWRNSSSRTIDLFFQGRVGSAMSWMMDDGCCKCSTLTSTYYCSMTPELFRVPWMAVAL